MTQKHHRKGSELPPLKPGVLRLYSMRFCPYAERTRLVLAHKKIPFETVNVHLKDKPEWFFVKNPLGLVPILELDDKVVYESTATCEWLDDVYPQYRLQPSDPYIKAWDRIHLEYFGKVTTAFYGYFLKPDQREKIGEDLVKHFKYYNDALAQRKGSFFGGSQPSMLDYFVWPHLYRMRALLTADGNKLSMTDQAKYPKLAEWHDAMLQLPAVKATHVDDKTLIYFLETAKAGNADYDYGIDE